MDSKVIYLDNNATTQLDEAVLEAMMPYFTQLYGNASSTHLQGLLIGEAVAEARESVADQLGAKPQEIIFTSGATEALNLAIHGLKNLTTRRKVITFTTEHKAVLEPILNLKKQGFEVEVVPVLSDGMIDYQAFEKRFSSEVALVAAMLVNNETGVLHNVKQLADMAHAEGAMLLTDATQAVGKIPVDVQDLGVDFMAFSAHKFHGPKGIGGLFVKKDLKLSGQIVGGGQERNRRSGTLNVPGIIGLAKALDEAGKHFGTIETHIKKLRDQLENSLLQNPKTHLNGNKINRLSNVSNLRFEGKDADSMMRALGNIMVSNGSACTASSIEPSHVLAAMGLSEEQAFSSLRFSLSRFTTEAEIEEVIKAMQTKILAE
jgi:cysteine desulfurase